MSRRKDNNSGWIVLILGLIIFGYIKLKEEFGLKNLLIGLGVFLALVILSKYSQFRKRRKKLMKKYDDFELVRRIQGREFWQGQSSEQLIDSLGKPEDIDEKVLKTKKKEIWKYQHESGSRYRLRITLENDIVVSWEQR